MDLTVSRFSYPWHLRSLSRALSPLTRVPSLGCLKPASVAKSAFTAAGIEEPRDPVERQSYLGSEFDDALTKLALEPFPALGKIH